MFNVYCADGEYFKTVYDENEADYTAWAIGGFYVIMKEYMYNIDGEHVIITETENGAIVEYPDGHKKTFNSYDEAINFLYRRGWIF